MSERAPTDTAATGPARVVKYSPPVGLSTLCRPQPKSSVRPTLDVSYRAKGAATTLRFSAREALGIPEQTLLLVLIEIAQEAYARSPHSTRLDQHVGGEVAEALWVRLNRGLNDDAPESVRFTTSWHELSERCGESTGGMNQRLRRTQLQRLCEVVVWEEGLDARRTTRQSYLVSWLLGDDARVHVALNARLAASLLGKQFAPVSLAERLALPSDTARALHAFFSTCVRPGMHLRVSIEALAQRLWPEADAPSGTVRRRNKAIRDGLDDLASLRGWNVTRLEHDIVQVKRLRQSVRDTTTSRSNANIHTLERERTESQKARKSVASEAMDASGLFLN